mgnify:CR=1 FL=1
MMNPEHVFQKVTPNHLKRDAYLYVRQSTLRQVLENTESTKRQYALRERAVALGWPIERIIVIDHDLGRSGASAAEARSQTRTVAEGSSASRSRRVGSGTVTVSMRSSSPHHGPDAHGVGCAAS